MAKATAPAALSREVLEDRWEGLMLSVEDPEAPSALALRWVAVLQEITGGMTREPVQDDEITSDLEDAFRERLVNWATIGRGAA